MAASTSNKTVLITGSTRGIGLKFVEFYIQRGWNVIGTARDTNKADQLKALSPYKIVQLDTSDEASITRAAKELEGEAIDLLINNAGIYLEGGIDPSTSEGGIGSTTKNGMMKQFEVNAVGPFLVTRAFVPHLKAAVAKHDGAYVVQLSSILGSITAYLSTTELSSGGHFGYSTSKAAVNMVNATLAATLKRDKIGAFVVHPGYVDTEINGNTGHVTTDASVRGLLQVFDKFSLADSGKFYDFEGNNLPW